MGRLKSLYGGERVGLGQRLKESLFGVPKEPIEIRKTGTLVLGAVEQTYGI